MPLPEFMYFSADCCMKFDTDVKHASHDLKDSTIKISQGHHVGAHFHKCDKRLGNLLGKI